MGLYAHSTYRVCWCNCCKICTYTPSLNNEWCIMRQLPHTCLIAHRADARCRSSLNGFNFLSLMGRVGPPGYLDVRWCRASQPSLLPTPYPAHRVKSGSRPRFRDAVSSGGQWGLPSLRCARMANNNTPTGTFSPASIDIPQKKCEKAYILLYISAYMRFLYPNIGSWMKLSAKVGSS